MRPLHTLVALTLALVAAARPARAADDGSAGPVHKLTGQYVEFCSCERFCETALEDAGRRSTCSFVAAFKIEAGQRADVSLGRLFAAIVVPGPPTADEKPGAGPVLYVDRATTPAQAEAIRAILSERFAARAGATVGPPRLAGIQVTRTSESVAVVIDGVADLRARTVMAGFNRPAQLSYAPGTTLGFPFLARGTGGRVADPTAGVQFNVDGRSVFYGKFDFGTRRPR